MTEKSLGRSYVRAFEDEGCDYYKLTQSLGELLPAGAIFTMINPIMSGVLYRKGV